MLPVADTIAAIATGSGRGGVGVVRISGCGVRVIAERVLAFTPVPRHAYYKSFSDEGGLPIDQGLVLFFSAPHSYTGEDVLELQGHGGPAVLQLLLQYCLSLGARLAEPGEFTRRAYLNNKLDLAQAEGVADLIEATTTQAARSAMRSLQGDFSSIVKDLVADLISLRMLVEAMLDFPEEEIESVDAARRDGQLKQIQIKLKRTLETAKQGSLLREGAYVALVGQPNVGKSSLLNRLAGEQVALVSDVPGTTRDVIRREIQINGIPLHIMDTAGLRDSEDVIEQMGIALTHQTLQKADLIILIREANQSSHHQDLQVLDALPSNKPVIYVNNKSDLIKPGTPPLRNIINVSAKTGDGIDELRIKILEMVGWSNVENGVFMARERHLLALQQAASQLDEAEIVTGRPELFAEELRLTQEFLNSITGEFTPDDLLGEIFSRFCIGK